MAEDEVHIVHLQPLQRLLHACKRLLSNLACPSRPGNQAMLCFSSQLVAGQWQSMLVIQCGRMHESDGSRALPKIRLLLLESLLHLCSAPH